MSRGKRKAPHHQSENNLGRNSKRPKTITTSSLLPRAMHDFSGLKAWIAHQEEYQAKTSQAAPLTDAQLKAIAELRLPHSKSHKDSEIGTTDWVTQLHQFRDANPQLSIIVNFTDDRSSNGSVIWLSTCQFKQRGEPNLIEFPNHDFGFVPLGLHNVPGQPSFLRKKDAKQYAAKCCVQWLISQPRFDGLVAHLPKGLLTESTPKSGALEKETNSVPTVKAPGTSYRPSASSGPPRLSSPHSPPPPLQAKVGRKGISTFAGPPDVHDDSVPATQRVLEMCRRLKIKPPRYELVPHEEGGSLWSGYPDFGIDSIVPAEVGLIENVYSKKYAKERVAENVLEYLIKLEAEREAQLAAITASSSAPTFASEVSVRLPQNALGLRHSLDIKSEPATSPLAPQRITSVDHA